jgi:hypothetical protein
VKRMLTALIQKLHADRLIAESSCPPSAIRWRGRRVADILYSAEFTFIKTGPEQAWRARYRQIGQSGTFISWGMTPRPLKSESLPLAS